MSSTDTALTKLVEQRIKHYHFHSHRMWVWHGWITGWTLIANILVPFGLASLLFVPETYHKVITVVLLAVSGLALALQLLTNYQRFPERALQLRSLHHKLETALANYRTGLKTDVELSATLGDTEEGHVKEVAP